MDEEKKKLIEGLAKEILFLDSKGQVYLAKVWTRGIGEDRSLLLEIHSVVTEVLYPGIKLDVWMEGRLRKNMSLTPKRVAYECRYYKRVSREMTPYLIRLARKVKKRMLTRQKRALKDKVSDSGVEEKLSKELASLPSETKSVSQVSLCSAETQAVSKTLESQEKIT